MQQAVLRLFKAVQVDTHNTLGISQDVTERTIKHGYVLEPTITPDKKLLDAIEATIGLSGEKANAAFHKSWKVVQEASIESLVIQQVLHYMTTYGFESVGIYDQETVYIPPEVLEVPDIKDGIPLVIIKAMDRDAILEGILNLASGIALSSETLADIMTIVESNKYDSSFVNQIGNRELKAMLCDFYGLVPSEPVEFLRYLISELTDETLLIKNDDLIEKIKNANGKFLDTMLDDAPKNLASIFYRYKPIFLALKSISRNKTFFNRLRKKAPKLHQPLSEDVLNNVTTRLKRGTLDHDKLQKALARSTVFRKIRLAYALKHRMHAGKSIVYRVRNGRGWATGFDWPECLKEDTQQALELVLGSLVEDIRSKLEGKTIFIPENVQYALPASEKQFTGHFPTGSSVAAPEDLIVGVHWMNTNRSIDLDLSVIGESGKYGWDADYRSKDRKVLFSGDITDAPPPHGATELFYLKSSQDEAKILMLNFFNHIPNDEVEAKILVANERPKKFDGNYMVNPKNIVASANINVTRKQNILGLIAPKDGKNRIYFAHVGVGTSISASNNAHSNHARNYLVHSLLDTLDFQKVLVDAGAIVTNDKLGDEDYDLSPEQITKTTIIDLLKEPLNKFS